MNTPAHVVFGLAAFGRPGRPGVTAAALLGGLAPDLSLYAMASWALYVQGIPARVVFDTLYYSASWQTVFAVDNSFVVWAGVLALGAGLRRRWLVAFAGAALLHLALDFPLHHDDARRHFWPLTDWVFVSPVSYWDGAHYGDVVAPVETGATLALCGVLWWRFRSRAMRAIAAALAAMTVLPWVMWRLVF